MKKKSNSFYQIVCFIPMVLAFVVMLIFMANNGLMDFGLINFMIVYFVGIAYVFLCMYIHIIIHEAGHLIAGLKSGYGFVSYRIGPIAFIKEDGKLKVKNYTIAGTAGQCLMSPPELKNEMIPTDLYNWGGVIINGVVSTIAILLSVPFPASSYWYVCLAIFGLIGYYVALQNGLPNVVGGIPNDGYNAINLKKDPKAVKAFYTSLKANQLQCEGKRIKDLGDLVYLPDKADRKNALIVGETTYYTSCLMDQHKFTEAKKAITDVLGSEGLADIYRYMLQCDLLTINALEKGKNTDLSYFEDKKFVVFYKKMLANAAVLRTEYAINKLVNQDEALAEKTLAKFEKLKKNYMIASEIEAESEIIEIIKNK